MPTICQCLPTVTSTAPSCNSNCIYAPHMLITDVTACDAATSIPLDAIISKCGTNPVSYSIHSYTNVDSPTISSTEIVFTPVDSGEAKAEIKYKISCGMLSDIGTIVIHYLDKCIGVTCASNEACDKCTGVCSPFTVDLQVSGNPTTYVGNSGLSIGN